MPNDRIRKEVMASIIAWMDALPDGVEPYNAALKHFKDVPDMVLSQAWMELEMCREEAWWQTIEKTIDGELINNALTKPAKA